MSLVGKYMGASLGKSMADIGEMMYRERAREDEREQDQSFRADQYRLNREAREDKPSLSDDQVNELAAGQLGMSVPEVAAHRNAVRTGDESEFNFDEYPAGISPASIQAKRKALYELLEQYGTGKDYKPLEEGRSEKHTRGLIDKAIENPDDAARIAQGVAAGEGKGAYGGNSDVVRNEFTGETRTTDVGRARIKNMQTDSSLDMAKIDQIEKKIESGTASKEDSDRLTTIIEKSTSTLKQLQDNPPGRDKAAREEWQTEMAEWQSLRERARELLSSRLEEREKPAASSNNPSAPAPKKDYRSLWK